MGEVDVKTSTLRFLLYQYDNVFLTDPVTLKSFSSVTDNLHVMLCTFPFSSSVENQEEIRFASSVFIDLILFSKCYTQAQHVRIIFVARSHVLFL